MRTLHLVSHTHWDREWYLPFQQFRLKLVRLIDALLTTLETNPEYRHFLLDGQTIVLDDYLHFRPENEPRIKKHIVTGRLSIGPWYILPDEFLVSPEATIRNLLQGERTSRHFGRKMQIGYLPDPFGHIGQMPQILLGFDIHSAVFRRGLSTEPCELWWEGPDGSRVFVSYLRDGYDNASHLPTHDPAQFADKVCQLRDSLLPYTATPHILLMQGTDHMEHRPDTTQCIEYTNPLLEEDLLVHSNLEAYISAVRSSLQENNLEIPTIRGELRSPQRHHLLPNVLSTRIHIKQRNHACQTALEKWVEPFSVWAALTNPGVTSSTQASSQSDGGIIRTAWRLLMENHPHDSICGCSIDQVHKEMETRFDQVDQIAETLLNQYLEMLSSRINTHPPFPEARFAVVVFNPVAGPRTDMVGAQCTLPARLEHFQILDDRGQTIPYLIQSKKLTELANMQLDREGFQAIIDFMQTGEWANMSIQDIALHQEKTRLDIKVTMEQGKKAATEAMRQGYHEIENALKDPSIQEFNIQAFTPATLHIQFIAPDVPGYGYRTFWLLPQRQPEPPQADLINHLENEYLKVTVSPADGTLTVADKRTGMNYPGLNYFLDKGDRGDEYNFCPPENDDKVSSQHAQIEKHRFTDETSYQMVEIHHTLPIPESLTPDRRNRSKGSIPLSIITQARLYPGVPRVDIHTTVKNRAKDHRLQVLFPTPYNVSHGASDGHFEVLPRLIGIPPFDTSWAEHPRPEVPQRAFTDISDGKSGLMIANRGLPEVALLPKEDNTTEIRLTLLRCVGWLSRDDLSTRQGHAGPPSPTPEAQMSGEYSFDYSIIPHSGDWIQAYPQAYAFNAPLRAVSTECHAGTLPPSQSFVEIQPKEWIVSAIKASEDGTGWILRGYNLASHPLSVQIKPFLPTSHVSLVNLAEKEIRRLKTDSDGRLNLPLQAHQITTVKFMV
ncbi:MAG: glycoside hydrolase family 38 C-terminal domain-containing protein [Chloroflexota bacterium]